jgi:hypothetical protein
MRVPRRGALVRRTRILAVWTGAALMCFAAASSPAPGQDTPPDPPPDPPPLLSETRDQGGWPAERGWPDGPGRDRTVAVCSNCHGQSPLRPQRADLWPGLLSFMETQGMPAYPDSIRQELLSYLQGYLSLDAAPPAP